MGKGYQLEDFLPDFAIQHEVRNSFPTVLCKIEKQMFDAWAYGIPCVVTPVGGLPDIVIDGENALVFPVGDVDMLSSQLQKMISDAFLREKIAQASLELAHTTFNIDCINKKMEDIYERFK